MCLTINKIWAQSTTRRAFTASWSGQIYNDTIWQDTVVINADVVVMPEAALTILPGTIIRFISSNSSKVDPYYYFPQTELIIRGKITAEGTSKQPIIFTTDEAKKNIGNWAGIIIDSPEKDNVLVNCRIEYAETGIYILDGEPLIKKNQFSFCNYALISQKQAAPIITQNTITDSEKGIYCLAASFPKIRENIIQNCQEEAIFVGAGSFPIIMDDNRFQNNRYDLRWMNRP